MPEYGCFKDQQQLTIEKDPDRVWQNVWHIGGDRGWYYANFLWQMRGFVDKISGGVGLRRGRRSPVDLKVGDALDFWRVLLADRPKKRLLLYAEMKLPGEAWLEFKIKEEAGQSKLMQTATFRPLGVWGRIYWYLMMPFHFFIFSRMVRNLASFKASR